MNFTYFLYNKTLNLFFKKDDSKIGGGIWVERSKATPFDYEKTKAMPLKSDEIWKRI